MPKNYCIMQIWAESGKSALPICNYSQILYQFLTFTQNLKRSPSLEKIYFFSGFLLHFLIFRLNGILCCSDPCLFSILDPIDSHINKHK